MPGAWEIEDEQPCHEEGIRAVTSAAFARAPHSSGTESRIVDALRESGALTISLVASWDDQVVGHVAFSPVCVGGRSGPWYGLGPVSVKPDIQSQGIGGGLVRAGLDRLRVLDAELCVVLGDPAYYGRFGFRHLPQLSYDIPIPEAFQCLVFCGQAPTGMVEYHAAFSVA